MPKILFVDDEARIREIVREAFSGQGYEVKTAAGADHALSLMYEEPFDLVLLDVNLDDRSGISVLKEIRKTRERLPIVIYSGFLTVELEQEARLAGANEVLKKDIGIPQLLVQIEKIIKAKERIFESSIKRGEKTILIVDDEENIRRVLKVFFKARNFKILEAESGERALELARSEQFSMVLLDIDMPGMGGMAALKKLLEINSQLGIVMVTGSEDYTDAKQALELGAYGYVLKPFEFVYLELVVMSKLIIAEGDKKNG